MSFTPYLSFQGECAEAMTTYAGLFGGEVELMRFADMPKDVPGPELQPDQAGWVMHAALTLPDGATLMAADMPPQYGGTRMAGASVAVSLPSGDEVNRVFDALSEGGQVRMAVGPTFFAGAFGMLTDRFGTSWMLMSDPID